MGCSLQKYIDIKGLKDDAKKIDHQFNSGNPSELRSFLDTVNFNSYTTPLHTQEIKIVPFHRWKLNVENLISEKIIFPSDFSYTKSDSAVFYIFRKGELTNCKVILWIPGMGVSDFAFKFIKKFFYKELSEGYNIVVYIPPFHLERKVENSNDGYLTSNTLNNVTNYLLSIRELRTINEYLQSKKVRSISLWGGSMGGSMGLQMSNYIHFEHVCIMIPIVDWYSLIVNNAQMKNIKTRLNGVGFDDKLLQKAYSLISPINSDIKINPKKSLILCANYDQIARLNIVNDFAVKAGISNIIVYNRSHSTILISNKMYTDYSNFLKLVNQ